MNATELNLAIHFLTEEPRSAARKLEISPSEHVRLVLMSAPPLVSANVVKCMLPSSAADALRQVSNDHAGSILSYLSVAEISSIFRHINGDELERLLRLLSARRRARCEMIISYPPYTVGALVETDALVLESSMRVEDALLRAKKKTFPNAQDIYVLNTDRNVIGTVSIYDLMRKPLVTRLVDLMGTSPPTVNGFTEISAAVVLPVWSKTDAAAVVNRHREYVGIVHHFALRHALTVKARKYKKIHSLPVELVSAYGSVLSSLVDTVSGRK